MGGSARGHQSARAWSGNSQRVHLSSTVVGLRHGPNVCVHQSEVGAGVRAPLARTRRSTEMLQRPSSMRAIMVSSVCWLALALMMSELVVGQAPAPKPTPTDGCCATCIGKSSDMPYTYDPVVHEQCAAAVGLCCYNCGSLEASKPQVENAEFGRDGVTPQVKAGEWIQISWSNVARVTYEYYRVNQNKTTTVRNASYEATQQNKYFTICAKAPGKIYVRGWGTDSCLMATPESYIEILPSTTNSQTCLDKPSFGSNTTPSPAPGDSRGNVVATDGGQARSQQQQIAECNLERASIKTKADGTQECQCTAEWSGPPLCTGFPWWKITLTAGGGLAALLSVIVSVRAFMASRRAKREQADSLEQQLRDSQAAILGPDSIVMMGDPGRGGRDNNNNNNDDVYHQYVSKKPKKELSL